MNINDFIERQTEPATQNALGYLRELAEYLPDSETAFWGFVRLCVNASRTAEWHEHVAGIGCYDKHLEKELKSRYPMHMLVAARTLVQFDVPIQNLNRR